MCRRSDSRYRASRICGKSAACSFGRLSPGDALPESRFALGYYRSPCQGFQYAVSPADLEELNLRASLSFPLMSLLHQAHIPAIRIVVKFVSRRRIGDFLDIIGGQGLQTIRIMPFGGVILLYCLVQ